MTEEGTPDGGLQASWGTVLCCMNCVSYTPDLDVMKSHVEYML